MKMATPGTGRPHSSSSPKNISMATPTSVMPSPRPPTSAAMTRNISSHKSVANRTPTPAAGHAYNVSTSSHPSSTPLTAPAAGEDPLSFNSPAAILHGLTPLPLGPEGLNIPSDLNLVTATTGSVLAGRIPEEEKLRRLQNVVESLKSRIAGRGICREGVERLAQLAGFTHLWQDGTLSIAGSCVDLEITFDDVFRDKATDVVLKISTPETEDHRKEASEVLMSNLEQRSGREPRDPWRKLHDFAVNLEQLGSLDHLSQGINCFEAVDGLYFTFRKIWDGEKRRTGPRKALERLSQSTTGRPVLNKNNKLGLTLEFWAEQKTFDHSDAEDVEDITMETDDENTTHSGHITPSLWTANIHCETGYPPLRVSKDWVTEEVFEDYGLGHDSFGVQDHEPGVAWTEPPQTLVAPVENPSNQLTATVDGVDLKVPSLPAVRFVANFAPQILVPWTIASSFVNKDGLATVLDESKITSYDQALRKLSTDAPDDLQNSPEWEPQPGRWKRSVLAPSGDGDVKHREHSYIVHSLQQLWCYPVQSVAFDHPKHLVEIFPTLRQYIILWTLLRNVGPSTTTANDKEGSTEPPAPETAVSSSPQRSSPKGQKGNRTNIDPRQAKLRGLFDAHPNQPADSRTLKSPPAKAPPAALAIDISVSMTPLTPSRPKLDIIWPLTPAKAITPSRSNFASFSVEIGVNGEVFVTASSGLPFVKSQRGLDAVAEMVSLSENLGLVVEALMEKVRS